VLREGIVDPSKSIRKAFAWAVGLNWYLSRNIKQVVNFERTTFTGGATDGADRPAENAFFIRTQVSF
jgi:phosphate-selective porin OprO/OprP